MQVDERVGLLQQVKQQRGGDVVGQVADEAQPAAARARERVEIKLERIRLVQLAAREVGELRLQARRQVAVDLDGIHADPARGQEVAREGAVAGADLHQVIAGLRCERAHDALDHARVVQEVLAEAFAARGPRRVAGLAHPCRCAARRLASRSAAPRLPASALPVPARSSAVP